jgi:hypothetical protein
VIEYPVWKFVFYFRISEIRSTNCRRVIASMAMESSLKKWVIRNIRREISVVISKQSVSTCAQIYEMP